MSDSSLESLARAAGLSVQWTDAFGKARSVSSDALHGLLEAMELPSHDEASRQASLRRIEERDHVFPALVTAEVDDTFDLPGGKHGTKSVTVFDEEGQAHTLASLGKGKYSAPSQYGYYQLDLGNRSLTLAVAPQRCFGVDDCLGSRKHRAWGLGAQVYSLRHSNDGGLGDSCAVAELAEAIGRAGGDALALSPLHAMSPIVGHSSPYSPSHRGFLNWMHADPALVLGESTLNAAIQQSGVASTWQLAQQCKRVNWSVAYAIRRNVFHVLHEQFAHATQALHDDLERFIAQGGNALHRYAWFAARQSQALQHGESTSWQTWQDDWRNEASAQRFAQHHPAEVDYEIFLQWLTARCWENTQQRARDSGQHIGLIWDLAVGFVPGGGEAWAWRDYMLQGLELGAPPDAFNPTGQAWGITSYSPWGLRASGFRPFIELLRANMARGGGIRIDHIIGFKHVWALPQGQPSTEGGYIRQPLQDLLRITALESWRQRCIVIGEDLGTVPEGLRDMLDALGVLGIDVLLFTRDEQGEFLAPGLWRKNAVAMTTTHDLPPLAGWREGRDIAQLAKAHGWDEVELQQRMRVRKDEVARLHAIVDAPLPIPPLQSHEAVIAAKAGVHVVLRREAKMDSHFPRSSKPDTSMYPPRARGNDGQELPTVSYFKHLTQTPSPLIIIPLEDALCLKDQPNLPGTIDSHPNWQHRLPRDTIDRLQPLLQSIGTSIEEASPA